MFDTGADVLAVHSAVEHRRRRASLRSTLTRPPSHRARMTGIHARSRHQWGESESASSAGNVLFERVLVLRSDEFYREAVPDGAGNPGLRPTDRGAVTRT